MKQYYNKILIIMMINLSLQASSTVKDSDNKAVSVESTTAEKQHPTINVFVNTANSAHASQNNPVAQSADHQSTPLTNVTTDMSRKESDPWAHQWSSKLHTLYEHQSQQAHTGMEWILNNKWKSLGMVLAVVYSFVSYHIYTADALLNNPESWSNWNNSISLDALFALDQQQLQADLMITIQTRYVHETDPTDFVYSIVQATKSLQDEMVVLKGLIKLYERLNHCSCMTFFFVDVHDIADLHDMYRKLSFLKHILASWCANYKIGKNNSAATPA